MIRLALARRAGIAFDREEHMQGICAAGVALRDSLGNMVAVSMPVPTHRFVENEAQITRSLLRTKMALTRLFDGNAA